MDGDAPHVRLAAGVERCNACDRPALRPVPDRHVRTIPRPAGSRLTTQPAQPAPAPPPDLDARAAGQGDVRADRRIDAPGDDEPRPTVGCPWPRKRREERRAEIAETLAALPPGHAAVYLDAVDVHLNPKVGPDSDEPRQAEGGRHAGHEAEAPPVRRAGRVDRAAGVVAQRPQDVLLFARTLRRLARETYAGAAAVHVVLDNFGIHDSKISRAAVAELGGRVVLHFQPRRTARRGGWTCTRT
jgi:hypothetical protein